MKYLKTYENLGKDEFEDGMKIYWDNDQIKRKLTLEEIEEYELSVNINKYNL